MVEGNLYAGGRTISSLDIVLFTCGGRCASFAFEDCGRDPEGAMASLQIDLDTGRDESRIPPIARADFGDGFSGFPRSEWTGHYKKSTYEPIPSAPEWREFRQRLGYYGHKSYIFRFGRDWRRRNTLYFWTSVSALDLTQ